MIRTTHPVCNPFLTVARSGAVLISLSVLTARTHAQDTPADGGKKSLPPLTLRVTAVGGVPPARFTSDPKAAGEVSIAELKAGGADIGPLPTNIPGGLQPRDLNPNVGPDGKLPPAGSGLFMLPEDPKEYPPRPLHIGTTKDAPTRYLWLTPGSTGIRFALPREEHVSFYRMVEFDKNGRENRPEPFYKAAADENTTHLTFFLRESPGADGWTKPRIIPIDTSPARLPAGSTLIVNMADTQLLGKVGDFPLDLQPGGRVKFPPGARDSRKMVRLDISATDPGSDSSVVPVPVSKTQRRVRDGDRLIIIAFRDRFAKDPLHRVLLNIYSDSAEPASLPAKQAPPSKPK